MALVGNRLLSIRLNRNIKLSEAADYFGISEKELSDIERYNGDYDVDLLLKSSKLYEINVLSLISDYKKVGVFKSPSQDEYNKFENCIMCFSALRNPKRSDVDYIKKPSNCTGPSSDYVAWKVLSSDYCLSGYVTMKRIEALDSLREGDVIVAIVRQKPVYGFFKMINDRIFIAPVNSPQKRLSLTAKGSKIIGLVKHLDINVN